MRDCVKERMRENWVRKKKMSVCERERERVRERVLITVSKHFIVKALRSEAIQ